MKFGIRTPSLSRTISARTVKRTLIPGYGRKGMGWLRDPRRAAYNKVYRKTTMRFGDLFK